MLFYIVHFFPLVFHNWKVTRVVWIPGILKADFRKMAIGFPVFATKRVPGDYYTQICNLSSTSIWIWIWIGNCSLEVSCICFRPRDTLIFVLLLHILPSILHRKNNFSRSHKVETCIFKIVSFYLGISAHILNFIDIIHFCCFFHFNVFYRKNFLPLVLFSIFGRSILKQTTIIA